MPYLPAGFRRTTDDHAHDRGGRTFARRSQSFQIRVIYFRPGGSHFLCWWAYLCGPSHTPTAANSAQGKSSDITVSYKHFLARTWFAGAFILSCAFSEDWRPHGPAGCGVQFPGSTGQVTIILVISAHMTGCCWTCTQVFAVLPRTTIVP
ncbi:hypothetical protein OBBRIDRAFT_63693 [Obba rivulosa]|uniref:Uncharacterized protein n=1 Tax=Obba rivulosa TaxID=1052685 RepID=A0A8E2AUY9_9APHY|nr:hypothetical protein OBBRIDRAFT_63693 [Obba rivulosa]